MTYTVPQLVLASSSPYRAALLRRLGLTFETCAPGIEERAVAAEPPPARAIRLARLKAQSVAVRRKEALVVGSDQVAVCNSRLLDKPGNFAIAKQQLAAASGRRVDFFTGICVINAVTGAIQSAQVPYAVYFRTLNSAEIDAYLHAEQPFDCAGSIKSEGLGLSLFERLQGEDPTALIGLPLITLCRMLRAEGWRVPNY